MKLHETDLRLIGADPGPGPVVNRIGAVRGLIGLIFVLTGTGIMAAHWLAADQDAAALRAPQQQIVGTAEEPSDYYPARYVNQAKDFAPHIEAF